jgi:hypothetical protein
MPTEPETQTSAEECVEMNAEEKQESSTLRVIGWLSVGVVVAAVGFFVGRKLLNRYKFNHRDPYDFYTHAGEKQTGEFGLGV